MEITDDVVMKKREHEAHMIPGVDGKKIFGFPNTILTKIRYCTFGRITASTGARAINVFAANGIFDPDITGVGHQPLYRDTYASIYDQYVVIGSKITVQFVSNQTDNIIVGINGNDDSTFPTNIETLMEGNNNTWSCVSQGTGGNNQKVLSMTFEPNEMFGVDTKSDGYSSTAVTANPTELWCYGVWCAALDGSSTSEVQYLVEIDYTVKFSELTDPTQS